MRNQILIIKMEIKKKTLLSLDELKKSLSNEWQKLDKYECRTKLYNLIKDLEAKAKIGEKIDEKLLNLFSKSDFEDLRDEIAGTAITPKNILEELKNDEEWYIRKSAESSIKRKKLPDDWKFIDYLQTGKRIYEEKEIKEEIIEILFNCEPEKWGGFEFIAFNKSTPESILKLIREKSISSIPETAQMIAGFRLIPDEWMNNIDLKYDRYRWVYDEVKIEKALNNNVSEETLTKLVEYGDRWIRRCVAANNKTPNHIIDKLKNNHQKENPLKYYDSELLEVINNRELPELWIGPNPITPYENTEHKIKLLRKKNPINSNIFKVLSRSYDYRIKLEIARHKETPKEILNILKNDTDQDVVKAVKLRGKEPTEIKLNGTGSAIYIYQISQKEYQKAFSKYENDEYFDRSELESNLVDEIYEIPEADLTGSINGIDFYSHSELKDFGCKFHKEDRKVSELGKYYLVKVCNYGDDWGSITIPYKAKFSYSELNIFEKRVILGSGNKSLNLNYAYMSYAENTYGSFSVPQLEGKSEEYYLIAEDGEVTYIN